MEASSVPMGPQLTEATYLMTRERAMLQAGDLRQKLGHRGFNQESLLPQMTQWLSRPVIKVLGDEMKNKVFMWCHKYSPSWLDEIRGANEDLSEYRYTTPITEPSSIDTTAIESLQKELGDKLYVLKKEIMTEQTKLNIYIRGQMQRLNGQHNSPQAERRSQRIGSQSTGSDISKKLQKVHQGLCLLVTEKSELVDLFHDIATRLDKDFAQKRSRPGARDLWSEDQLEDLTQHQTLGLGMGRMECKLLKNIVRDASAGEVSFEDVEYFCRQVTTHEQFKEIMEGAGLL
jgi:hypothetical protein